MKGAYVKKTSRVRAVFSMYCSWRCVYISSRDDFLLFMVPCGDHIKLADNLFSPVLAFIVIGIKWVGTPLNFRLK